MRGGGGDMMQLLIDIMLLYIFTFIANDSPRVFITATIVKPAVEGAGKGFPTAKLDFGPVNIPPIRFMLIC